MAKKSKKLNNPKGFLNSLFPGLILFLSVIAYLFQSYQLGHLILVFPLDLILVGHFGVMLFFQQIYLYMVKKDEKSNGKQNKKSGMNKKPLIKSAKDFTMHQEGGRKALHLLGFLLIPPYFGMGLFYYNILRVILNFINAPPMNINSYYIPQTIALLGILTAFIFVMVPEIYRMFEHKYCMLQRFMKILRKDEMYSIGPHINMIVGMIIPIILIPEPFMAVGTLFSGIMADGIASVMGKKYGKHIFNKKNNKTIEGLLAATATSFLTSFIFYIFNYPLWQCILFSSICCIIFAIIDYLSLPLSDNILIPVITGFLIILTYNILIL
ncbi:MAG: hypothetical protein GF329_16555 [Candidatus Lokiarchaeota archaeon]|nr:hypothetical protein [Candidatus Lokiarchaeota archaeon]